MFSVVALSKLCGFKISRRAHPFSGGYNDIHTYMREMQVRI